MAKVDASIKPTMDALVADGTLVGYGSYGNRIHSEASPTHGSWFQAESLTNIFKALDKIYAQAGARFWMGHENETVGDDYSKMKEDVAFRLEQEEKVGLGLCLHPRLPKLSVWPVKKTRNLKLKNAA